MSTDAQIARRWLVPAVSGAALVGVTLVVVITGHLGPFDGWVIDRFTPVPVTGPVHAVVTALSATASAGVGIAVLLLLGLTLTVRRRDLLPLATTSLATFLLVSSVYVGKWAVGRARPLTVLPVDPEPAFPSGHSTTAVVVVGCALLLLGAGWSVTARRIASVALACYAGAIGICRLYLGLHWLSDVLAGWLLGITIVGLVAATVATRRAGQADPAALPAAHLDARSV